MTAADKADSAAEAAAESAQSEEAAPDADAAGGPLAVQLEERTADLKRITAEYQNYRKRVERDRDVASDQATAAVVAGLLPVLDDVDRARDHGDLVGPFASVAEQLQTALTKLGLSSFGEPGDTFDPTLHEAVAHMHSAEVAEPTCIDVMRQGYLLGGRLLRAAMVAVAEPAEAPATEPDSTTGSDSDSESGEDVKATAEASTKDEPKAETAEADAESASDVETDAEPAVEAADSAKPDSSAEPGSEPEPSDADADADADEEAETADVEREPAEAKDSTAETEPETAEPETAEPETVESGSEAATGNPKVGADAPAGDASEKGADAERE